MKSLRTSVASMLSNQTWDEKKQDLAAKAAALEEERRQEAARRAEAQRLEIRRQGPRIIEKVLGAIDLRTLEGITKAQELLGDRTSNDPEDRMYRDEIGEALVTHLYKDKEPGKKRLTGYEAYSKLQNFLYSASNGLPLAEQLTAAFERDDYGTMLRLLQPADERDLGSLAAAVALSTYEGSWVTSTWSVHGFDTLKALKARAEEVLRLQQEAGVQPESETPTVAFQLPKAS